METTVLTARQVEILLTAKLEDIAWHPLWLVIALDLRERFRYPADPEAFAAFDPCI